MIRWIADLLRRAARLARRRSSGIRIQRSSDFPDRPKRGILYVIGEDGYDWAAAMQCPGGCGKLLEMNLYPDAHPVWSVTEHQDGTVSLTPSVWLKTGCRCHFILRAGRVIWV